MKGRQKESYEQWFGVEQYIQNLNVVGKNNSTVKHQSAGIP